MKFPFRSRFLKSINLIFTILTLYFASQNPWFILSMLVYDLEIFFFFVYQFTNFWFVNIFHKTYLKQMPGSLNSGEAQLFVELCRPNPFFFNELFDHWLNQVLGKSSTARHPHVKCSDCISKIHHISKNIHEPVHHLS